MNGRHPNLGAIVLAALAILSALVGGCSHNQASIPNPFLAPDRVPPPSTRVIAPGTALPYYQGDPLPVMQSGAPAPTAAPPVAAAEVPTEPKQIAFSNEPSVAIPADDDSLRFELSKPRESAPTPTAVAATPRAAPTTSTATGNVGQAIYNAPSASSQPVAGAVQAAALSEPVVSNPWRSPRIPSAAPPVGNIAAPPLFAATTTAPPMYMPQSLPPGYVVVPPMTAPPPSVDVTLRAVSSPSPEPLESSSPRIRIPGYPAPPTTGAPAAVASPDGFRPRSSMR